MATRTARPVGHYWSTYAEHARFRTVQLTGHLFHAESRALLVVVHGLGGHAQSRYMTRPLLLSRGRFACLLLNLRGADRLGEDFYHAALTQDLHATLTSPALARYNEIVVLGYSLGGHVAVCYGCESGDPRLRAVASICAPLELDRAVWHLDRPRAWLYRRYILRGLRQIYGPVSDRRRAPTPLSELAHVTHIRAWDEQTVVVRDGWSSAEAYYAWASAEYRLPALRVPTLLINSDCDPMIPLAAADARRARAGARLEWRVMHCGGHVGFPPGLDLGMPGAKGLEAQILSWFEHTVL